MDFPVGAAIGLLLSLGVYGYGRVVLGHSDDWLDEPMFIGGICCAVAVLPLVYYLTKFVKWIWLGH